MEPEIYLVQRCLPPLLGPLIGMEQLVRACGDPEGRKEAPWPLLHGQRGRRCDAPNTSGVPVAPASEGCRPHGRAPSEVAAAPSREGRRRRGWPLRRRSGHRGWCGTDQERRRDLRGGCAAGEGRDEAPHGGAEADGEGRDDARRAGGGLGSIRYEGKKRSGGKASGG
jgi:hypothetical protein